MRILHIIDTLDPAAGGPSESVRVLMSFAPIGYSGEVVTLDVPDAPFLAGLPFPHHALGSTRYRTGPNKVYGYNQRLAPWLTANRDRFDGIVVNGLWQYCGLAAWLTLRKHKPYVVFSHGMLDPYFKRAFPLKHLKKWIYWLLVEFWVLRGAFRVLFTTAEEARLAKETFWLHQWKTLVVPYGASRPSPSPPEDQKQIFYNHYPNLRGKRFLLFLGRIHPKKGCDLLIKAFCKLANQDPELHLVMAGPDQIGMGADLQQQTIEAGLGDRVHWTGLLKGSLKWGAFYASEAFILPSHQENFGIAVAEALACRRPVLLTNKVNIAHQIAEAGAGVVETDTQIGTETLITRWMNMDTDARSKMGDLALECFDRNFDMRRNAETIIRLFEAATKLQ